MHEEQPPGPAGHHHWYLNVPSWARPEPCPPSIFPGALGQQSGDIGRAIDHYITTLSIARETRDSNMEQEACGSLATAYRMIANYPKAIDYLELRMELALATEERSVVAETSFRLGLCYYSLDRYRKASQLFQQSLETAQEIGDTQLEDNCKDSLSRAQKMIAMATTQGQHWKDRIEN